MNRLTKLTVMMVVAFLPVAASALPPVMQVGDLQLNANVLQVLKPRPAVSPSLSRYFSSAEITEYKNALSQAGLAPLKANGGDDINRLTDPNHNRCGNDVLPVGECPQYQELAWNDGNGCINVTEYNYALANAIAPICSPFDETQFLGWCRCGCFEKTTTLRAISLRNGEEVQANVSEISADSHEVFAMTEDSTLSSMSLAPRALTATTVGDEELPLVWVRLANGVALGLTTEHAVLLSSGIMVTAESLTTSDFLVAEDGQPVAITQIDRSPTADPVYNVLTDAGLAHKGHIIVANGIVVGDIMWQNTLAADLGDVVVRD